MPPLLGLSRCCNLRQLSSSSTSSQGGSITEGVRGDDATKPVGSSSSSSSQEKSRTGRSVLLGGVILGGVAAVVYFQYSSSFRSTQHEQHQVFRNKPRFTSFSVVETEDTSPTAVLLTLRPSSLLSSSSSSSPDHPYEKSWQQGTWSVEFKQPQLQIARSYTPLPPAHHSYVDGTDAGAAADLRFYIRRERNGEMSNYLANLPVGATVELRGPDPEIDIPPDVSDVVYLAGGTGIAPAFQVIHTLFERRQVEGSSASVPNMRIVWANRRREDCIGGVSSNADSQDRSGGSWWSWGWFSGHRRDDRPAGAAAAEAGALVRELAELQKRYDGRISVEYLVDEEGGVLDEKKIRKLVQQGSSSSNGNTTATGKKLLFVSGPEGFVRHFAGAKVWEGGRERQGELGGVIARMNLGEWQVCKL